MRQQRFSTAYPGMYLTAAFVNQVTDALEEIHNVCPGGDVGVRTYPGITAFDVLPPTLVGFVRLTETLNPHGTAPANPVYWDGTAHDWVPTAEVVTVSETQNTTVSNDSVLAVYYDPASDAWLPLGGGGGGGTPLAVLDLAGAPVDAAVASVKASPDGVISWEELSAGNVQLVYTSPMLMDTVNPGAGDTAAGVPELLVVHVDQGSGLKVTPSTGGSTTLSAQAASGTHAGVVTLGGQILGTGKKTAEKLALELTAGTSTPGQDMELTTITLPFSVAEDAVGFAKALLVTNGSNDCGVAAHEFNWVSIPGNTNTFRSFASGDAWILAYNTGSAWQDWVSVQPNFSLPSGNSILQGENVYAGNGCFAVNTVAGGGITAGKTGTDPIGNVFAGGIITTLSTIVGASGTDATGSTISGGLVTGIGTGSSLIRVGTPAGGDLSGTYPDPTVARVNGIPVDGAPIADAFLKFTLSDGGAHWVAGSGVSSITVTTPPEILVSGTHSQTVTTSGTFTLNWQTVTPTYFLAGPVANAGAAAVPTFRAVDIKDLPVPVASSTAGGGTCTVVGSWEDNGPVEVLPGPGSYLITLTATGTATVPPSGAAVRLSARMVAVDQNAGPITGGQTLVAEAINSESREGSGSVTVLFRYTTGSNNHIKVQSLLTGGAGGMGSPTGDLGGDADGNATRLTWVLLGP